MIGPANLSQQRTIPGLDGLRAVAVVLVVLYHCLEDLSSSSYLRPVAEIGWFGVPIFFCLSGFLITHLLLGEERRYGEIDLGRFYARRAIRIVPPLLPLVVVFVLLDALGWFTATPISQVSCLLFFRNLVPGPWVTGHLWTLAVEEHFYLIWPLVFLACRSPRWRLTIVTLAIMVAPAWRHAILWQAGSSRSVNWFRTDLRYDGILMGCLLALATNDARLGRWLGSRVLTHGFAAIVACLVLATTFTRFLIVMAVLVPTVQFACIAVLLNQITRSPRSWSTRFLEVGAIAWLGRLSYSLYLWQQLFVPPAWPAWSSKFVHIPFNIGFILTPALISYYCVEIPCSRWRSRFQRRPAGILTHDGSREVPACQLVVEPRV